MASLTATPILVGVWYSLQVFRVTIGDKIL